MEDKSKHRGCIDCPTPAVKGLTCEGCSHKGDVLDMCKQPIDKTDGEPLEGVSQ